jgi:hypothetical protein
MPYIVIDVEEGVQFKRLYFHGSKTVELVSDNTVYKPYTRHFNDILAIFKFQEKHSRDFTPDTSDVRRDVRELREEIAEIKRLLAK